MQLVFKNKIWNLNEISFFCHLKQNKNVFFVVKNKFVEDVFEKYLLKNTFFLTVCGQNSVKCVFVVKDKIVNGIFEKYLLKKIKINKIYERV